jgi:hypothetical protein
MICLNLCSDLQICQCSTRVSPRLGASGRCAIDVTWALAQTQAPPVPLWISLLLPPFSRAIQMLTRVMLLDHVCLAPRCGANLAGMRKRWRGTFLVPTRAGWKTHFDTERFNRTSSKGVRTTLTTRVSSVTRCWRSMHAWAPCVSLHDGCRPTS